jgi:indolepyruvate ferredoxin oxidoreductase beta subunit
MKKDIILAGVGGQGTLSIATAIGTAALKEGLQLKQAEVHGMSQRGGDVSSHLRISDKEIFADIIPEGQADLILAVEPMEALRHLSFLKPEGWIITSEEAFVNIPNYPDIETIYAKIREVKNHKIVPAEKIAREVGNTKVANIVMLGAAGEAIGIKFEALLDAIDEIFAKKSLEIAELNKTALRRGRDFGK